LKIHPPRHSLRGKTILFRRFFGVHSRSLSLNYASDVPGAGSWRKTHWLNPSEAGRVEDWRGVPKV
jgi:hypothetical protein